MGVTLHDIVKPVMWINYTQEVTWKPLKLFLLWVLMQNWSTNLQEERAYSRFTTLALTFTFDFIVCLL